MQFIQLPTILKIPKIIQSRWFRLSSFFCNLSALKRALLYERLRDVFLECSAKKQTQKQTCRMQCDTSVSDNLTLIHSLSLNTL